MNEQLIEYIRRNIGLDHHPMKIMQVLLNDGWDAAVVEQHIRYVLGSKPKKHLIESIKDELSSNIEKYFIVALVALLIITFSVLSFNYFINLGKGKAAAGVKIVSIYNESENLDFLNKALIKNDETICDEISDDRIKEQCKNSFVRNKSVCDEQCQNANILNLAIIRNNESLCADMANESLRNNCLDNFKSAEKTAEQACDKDCKDKELLNLALIRHNKTICLEINNSLTKNQCEQMFVEVNEK